MTHPSLAEDEEALARYADDLSVRIRAVLGTWVVGSIRRVAEDQGIALDDTVARRAAQAADRCIADIGTRVSDLLAQDIDAQSANPLQVLRDAVRYPSGVLHQLGARPVPRDRFAVEAFPDDVKPVVGSVRPGLSGIGSVLFRDEESLLDKAEDARGFHRDVITPYKGRLEQWYVEHQGLSTYMALIALTLWVVGFPESRVVWRIFLSLPQPPEALAVLRS